MFNKDIKKIKLNKKKFFSIISYVLFIPLVSLIILFVGSVLPISGNYQVMTVLSGSMEPAIKIGSLVVVKPMNDYRIGDIITFKTSSGVKIPTTHRIVEMEVIEGALLYTTQGDANNASDSKRVYENQVEGRVIISIKFLGFGVDFIKKPSGFFLMIILPAGIIIFVEGRKIFKELKNNKKKKLETDDINIENE